MSEPHVVTALIAKRAELAGALEAAQGEVRRLLIELDAVDATLRIFKPDIELALIRPKPLPPRHSAYKGEVARILFSRLRAAHNPMTVEELAMHVMAERGLNVGDRLLLVSIRRRVNACLRHYRNRGVVRSEKGAGQRLVWRLA